MAIGEPVTFEDGARLTEEGVARPVPGKASRQERELLQMLSRKKVALDGLSVYIDTAADPAHSFGAAHEVSLVVGHARLDGLSHRTRDVPGVGHGLLEVVDQELEAYLFELLGPGGC